MAEKEEDSKVDQGDIFGLPNMSTNTEIGISFTLFILGMLLTFSSIYAARHAVDIGPGILGLLLFATSYLFVVEAVRELEEKDHFLSKKLMSR